MTYGMLLLTAAALAMDAFAVSISYGLCIKLTMLDKFKIPFSFGFFQGFMPIIGCFAAELFAVYIQKYDHWIAFIMLFFIGAKMIYETLRGDVESECPECGISFGKLVAASVAVSIDAMAVGVSFALIDINVWASSALIALVTFLVSLVGINFGSVLGSKSKKISGIIGGLVLIGIGIKILTEHLLS